MRYATAKILIVKEVTHALDLVSCVQGKKNDMDLFLPNNIWNSAFIEVQQNESESV